MSSLTAILLLCCVLLISRSVGQNNEVCLTLSRNSNDANPQTIQGARGMRGPVGGVGPKGVQGQKGEPGDVETCGCSSGDVMMLKEQVRYINTIIEQHCLDGLSYDNRCIKFPSPQTNRLTFAKAQQFCNNLNTTLAEIRSDAMYDKVYNFLLTKLKQIEGTRSFTIRFWLGSTFETSNNPNNLVTLTNGTKVRLTKWSPGAPYKGSSYKTYVNLAMIVNSQVGDIYRDIWNTIPSGTRLPLCSYNI